MERLRRAHRRNPGLWLGLLVFLLATALLLTGIGGLFPPATAAQAQALADTLRGYAVHCYAVEGRYPETLSGLAQRYGLTLDETRFTFHYAYAGANLLPEIFVFPVTERRP